ncbi:MAG: hypothetical protein CL946_10065 [Ectothiorhodospiraceae bacterium]|nr:hypothetical protein [Ectothiorhodospiraceae bacterium]
MPRFFQRVFIGGSILISTVSLTLLFSTIFPVYLSVLIVGTIFATFFLLMGKWIFGARKLAMDSFMRVTTGLFASVVVAMVAFLMFAIVEGGYEKFTLEFLTSHPAEGFLEGGIFPMIVGTAMLVIIMSVVGVPVGVMTAIYLTEYAKESSLIARTIRFCLNVLAGIPPIVIGLFGLGFFIATIGRSIDTYNAELKYNEFAETLREKGSPVAGEAKTPLSKTITYLERTAPEKWKDEIVRLRSVEEANPGIALTAKDIDEFFVSTESAIWGRPSLLWAALTMALLTLPVVVVSVEEAIRAVPRELREASYSLGGSRLETVVRVILPSSSSGIATGTILAVSRGAGEVAPILFTGVAYFLPDIPSSLHSQFMELGYHIYILATQSTNVAVTVPMQFATTLALLLLTFSLNFTAIVLRARLQTQRAKYA